MIDVPHSYVQVASLLVLIVSAAQAGDVVYIRDVALDPGDTAIIPIRIYDATGVAAVGLNLSYDPCVVNLTGAHQGDFTGFFGFDNRNVTDGWTRINTYITCRDLTGDLTVVDVTLVAVGKSGDASPLNIEILAMADQNGTNIHGTTRNGTFGILVPAPAASTSTHSVGGETDSNSRVRTNIVMRETKCIYASKGRSFSYKFEKPMNDIVYVNFTTTIYTEDVCTIVEMLKGTSASAEPDPLDNVYGNTNIMVVSRDVAERNIRDVNITFKIKQSWIGTIDPSTVRLNVYHNDAWLPLKTTRLGEDESHVYFMADTDHFGRFAITASDSRVVLTPVDKPATEQIDRPPAQAMPTRPSAKATLPSAPGFNALFGLIGLVIVCLLRRR